MRWLPYPMCKPHVVATYITSVVNNVNRGDSTKWERVLAFVPAPVPPRYVPPWEKYQRNQSKDEEKDV